MMNHRSSHYIEILVYILWASILIINNKTSLLCQSCRGGIDYEHIFTGTKKIFI